VTTAWAAFLAVGALQGVLPSILVIARGHAAALALRELIDATGQPLNGLQFGASPQECEGHVEISRVSFAYPSRPDHSVLNNVTMRFAAGRLCFVVGRSGSGKSTLAALLSRLYDSDDGSITIDSHDTQQLNVSWVRNNVTIVEQHAALFNEKLAQNIALGSRHPQQVSQWQLDRCIDFAGLASTLAELPSGADTRLGGNLSLLSGGQRQRIALARARLRDTPILVLDESTSMLDQESRAQILENIRIWRKGMTTIIITHDTAQLQNEDYVYVLEDGRVAEHGHLHELSKATERALAAQS
jgi:ATP-binding cassette, subfamily B (MDR/TAP), member 1